MKDGSMLTPPHVAHITGSCTQIYWWCLLAPCRWMWTSCAPSSLVPGPIWAKSDQKITGLLLLGESGHFCSILPFEAKRICFHLLILRANQRQVIFGMWDSILLSPKYILCPKSFLLWELDSLRGKLIVPVVRCKPNIPPFSLPFSSLSWTHIIALIRKKAEFVSRSYFPNNLNLFRAVYQCSFRVIFLQVIIELDLDLGQYWETTISDFQLCV